MVLTGVYYLKISLIPPFIFLLKCLCQGQEYERSCTCICVLGYRDCQKIMEEDSLNRYIELIADTVGLG
jgi:hypothetical protein